MIRKTSLLRKIEPTTRRSSFVGKEFSHGSDASKAFVLNSWRLHSYLRQIALRGSCSDRSPLYDVRNPASNIRKDITSEVMLSRTSNDGCPYSACREHTMKKGDWSGFDPLVVRPSSPSIRKVSGGGRRDRTDDLMLAKHALSQLSYAPVPENTKLASRLNDRLSQAGLPSRSSRRPSAYAQDGLRRDILALACASEGWWAWEDLNFRPHAYQARALTN
jgi:hypothetical protein